MTSVDETEVPFVLKYCRTCSSQEQLLNIFGEEGKKLRITEKIRKCLSILVLEEDLLPKMICTDCCSSLEEFSQYKESAHIAQEKLKGIASDLKGSKGSKEGRSGNSANTLKPTRLTSVTGLDCIHKKESDDEAVEIPSEQGQDFPTTEMTDGDVIVEEVVIKSRVDTPPNPETYPCDFCNEVFPVAASYYSHLCSSHKGRRFLCPHCSVSYSQKVSLNVHMSTHHNSKAEERKYQCYICQKLYKTSKCLAKHVATHLSVNKFICQVCQKGFNKKSRLEEHHNTHNPDSYFGCTFCTKKFNSYSNYLKHFRKIHKEKCLPGDRPPPPIKHNGNDSSSASVGVIEAHAQSTGGIAMVSQITTAVPLTSSSTWSETDVLSPAGTLQTRTVHGHGVNSLEPVVSTIQTDGSTLHVGSELETHMNRNNAGTGNIPSISQSHGQSQPMELCYKLSNTGFQEPMELTKVFQDSGPLELCVRTENDLCQLIDLTSANPKDYTKLDLIDLSGVAGSFQAQHRPIDLINREVCTNTNPMNNSMDLSLRSSFQDQAASCFIRELLDLSSRSDHDSSHHQHQMPMDLNLNSSKHLQQQQSQHHRSAPHPVPHNFLNVYSSDTLF